MIIRHYSIIAMTLKKLIFTGIDFCQNGKNANILQDNYFLQNHLKWAKLAKISSLKLGRVASIGWLNMGRNILLLYLYRQIDR